MTIATSRYSIEDYLEMESNSTTKVPLQSIGLEVPLSGIYWGVDL